MDALTAYTLEHRLFVLVLASYLALIIGGPRWLHHVTLYDVPAKLWRGFVSGAERRMNRAQRTKQARRFRGRLVFALLVGITLALAGVIVMMSMTTSWGWYAELVVLAYLLPIRAACLPLQELRGALAKKELRRSEDIAATLPTLNDLPADKHTAIRASIGYLAECLPRYVIVPSLYYLLLGLPGLMLCRLLTLIGDLFPIQQHRAFTGFAYKLTKFLFMIPVQLATFLMWVALMFVPKASPSNALKAFQHQVAGALPVKLTAYGMDYTLGGVGVHDSIGHHSAWIGEGRAKLELQDLNRCLVWYLYSAALWLLVITALVAI